MNEPVAPISGITASLEQATGYPAVNYNRPKGRGIKPLSAWRARPPEMGLVRGGGLKNAVPDSADL